MPLHVAIIGAGPAGSAAAITLARAGQRVTLFERAAFPRVKVCGECISPAATSVLEGLIDPALLRRAGMVEAAAYTLACGDRQTTWTTPHTTLALSRSQLDSALLNQARDLGAQVHSPVEVRSVDYSARGVQIRTTATDAPPTDADCVIHADGAGRHDPRGPTPNRPGVIGAKCHIMLPRPLVGVHMRSAPGAYIGLVQVENALATIALTVRSSIVAHHRGDLDAALASLWPDYSPAMRAAAGELGAWKTCGIAASGYITPGHPRSFRIGNAAAAVEPVGGEGIGLALWAGAELGKLLATVQSADATALAAVERSLARQYKARVRWRIPSCRLAAWALMHPGLIRWAWPVLQRPALALAPWWHLSGKPA